FLQWLKSLSRQNAEFLGDLINRLLTDNELNEMSYLIDYGTTDWYTNHSFMADKDLERKADKLFAYYSYICYLKRSRIINDEGFSFFEYRIKRALNNRYTKDYFYNLYHFSRKQNILFTFEELFNYGKSVRIYEPEFFDSKAYAYPNSIYTHNLNF
ncbi:MAG: hypothetical protein K2I75_02325, partial [Clostridiales bacterium]|nr:hypothetical protein [Clostridiales bacterium]